VAGKHMSTRKLMEERDALKKQIENLQSELKGLERAIRVVSGSDEALAPISQIARTRTKNVKNTVLTLVSQSGNAGITVGELMDKAEASQVALEKASVSSLLSRLKKEGVLRIDDGRYYDISQNQGTAVPH
jgi:stalled ribosome rescue protein Dom34